MATSRRIAREIALQIVFQREFAPQIQVEQLAELHEKAAPKESVEYAKSLVDGVSLHIQEIDGKIQGASRGWKLDRMPAVDRCLLRICIFEMVYSSAPVPPKICIDEAIEIAKRFSTQESGAFVNGVLDTIARESNLTGP